MDLLLLLRISTALGRVALLVALITLLRTGRGATTGGIRRPAWVLITWIHGVFILSGLAVELLHIFGSGDATHIGLRRALYYHLFLLNCVLDAALPVAILMHFLAGTRYRGWSLAGLLLIIMTGVVGSAGGALRSWGELLDVSQVLTFQAIVGYLIFFGIYLLKRLPAVDFYLAAFLAVDAAFVLVLPIQQVFFQAVGLEASWDIWHLHQLLQLTATGIQVVIVLSYLNSMRYRPLAPLMQVPE